ncbi:ankyrin repeat-containing domain protein [Chaetomium sp. MPI-CAGE-AT-0009]|nr:ankyrin repeat-containing domain protein [Chaetomium sp. MPI-CAGE-AT-0009]
MNGTLIQDLPTELLYHIIALLLGDRAFGSVASLALSSRQFCGGLSLLYSNVGRINLDAGGDALIWATENGEFETLKALLENGVDPNARFWSTLPDCSRQHVFAAQRVRRRLSPRLDAHLIAKLLEEDIVRHRRCGIEQFPPHNNSSILFREWYLVTMNGDMPETLDVVNHANRYQPADDVAALVREAHFGCRPSNPSPEHPRYLYSWTALHVATKRGDERAVELLLAHGADLEWRCRGLCDCITPVDRDTPRYRPPSFTALHIAVCSGHEHFVRLFLARGANPWLAGRMNGNVLDSGPADNGITVFQTAALKGNVAMCRFLLHHDIASVSEQRVGVLQRQDPRGLHALDYAVAAGHIRTTGRWLLCQVGSARPDFGSEDGHLFSLNFLCHRGQYRDAQYLLNRIRPSSDACTSALQFCFMPLPSQFMPLTTTLGSLRAYLNAYMAVYVSQKAHYVRPDGEEALVCLVRQLLDRGANPGTPFPSLRGRNPPRAVGKTALHLAASCGQRAVLQVMLDAGAPIDHHVNFRPVHPGVTGGTPLGWAMISPEYSPAYNNPRAYLETIVFLLERGASFRNSLRYRQEADNFKDWFSPLFSHRFDGVPWYNLDHFDLFERVMELVAKQLGEERFPPSWLTDLMDLGIMCGTPNGNFCKWLVQNFGVVSTDFSDSDLVRFTPTDPDKGGRYKPGMMEFLVDFIPSTTVMREFHERSLYPTISYARQGHFIPLKVLVERGFALERPRPGGTASEDEVSEDPSRQLRRFKTRCQNIILDACRRAYFDGSVELIHAVLSQLPKLGLGDHPERLLYRGDEHAISRLISLFRLDRWKLRYATKITMALRVLLQHATRLYGVVARRHGEYPSLIRKDWHYPETHPFVYPVPVVVDMERWDLLEVVLTNTAPPQQDEILEALAMALDTTYRQADPAGIRVILDHSPVDVSALIPRPAAEAETGNGVTGHVSPLYYLLKTFYSAHVIPLEHLPHGRRCRCHHRL